MNKMFEYLTDQPILRWVFGGIGGLYAYIQPTYVYLWVCIFAILLDCFFAWDMARRVERFSANAGTDEGITIRKAILPGLIVESARYSIYSGRKK